MLTLFTTAKAFRGHDGVIQRNALQSWMLLHPDVEVILFGDDEGAAEVCAELGIRHEPRVERHQSGTKQLDYMFRRANEIARHPHLCYSNCDIVLMQDFWEGFQKARAWRERFLLIAHRWDIDLTAPIAFDDPAWAGKIREFALTHGVRQNHYWIDFFLFRKGLFLDMPPLIVGHCFWDNWMIWRALKDGVPVVDASELVVAVHQNHGYSVKFGRVKGVSEDSLSQHNLKLIGGYPSVRHIRSASHRLTQSGAVRMRLAPYTDPVRELILRVRLSAYYRIWLPVWHFFLNVTRPLRSVLGLRSPASKARERA